MFKQVTNIFSFFKVKKIALELVIIPEDMTSRWQVFEIIVNKPFNNHFTESNTESSYVLKTLFLQLWNEWKNKIAPVLR